MLRISLSGNLGADPEKRYTQDGKPILRFSLAHNRYASKEQRERNEKPKTDWFRVSISGPRADSLEDKLHTGMRVFVVGRLDIGEYESREGEHRVTYDVWAEDIDFVGQPRREQQDDERDERRPAGAGARSAPSANSSDLEDLPF